MSSNAQKTQSLGSKVLSAEERNESVIHLLHEWLDDESGYDEQTWPIVKKALQENHSSYRDKFHD